MSPLSKSMRALLDKRKTNSAFRQLTLASSTTTDFSSNDFLSLSTSPVLKSEYIQELSTSPDFRLGSGGSRLLDGNSAYTENLEKSIAEFHNAPAALLFNSGFFACVPQPGDVVVYDEFIHASVHEGMRLSRAGARVSFKHNSVPDLRRVIGEVLGRDEKVALGERCVFVAVEGLYSMDGDLAPLGEIVGVMEGMLPRGNGYLVVDEAHSGVYAMMRRGDTESLITHLSSLISYMYSQLSTLMPLTSPSRSPLQLLSIPAQKPQSPIFALLTLEPRSLAKHCQDAGLMVRAIVPPTVPEGTQRVRVCLHAGNTFEDVDRLVARIRDWLEGFGRERDDGRVVQAIVVFEKALL